MLKPTILYKRHIAKAITWRVFSSVITFSIAYFFLQGNSNVFEKALELVFFESILKVVFYFLHERAWYNLTLPFNINSRVRHLLKSFTYRIGASVGTIAVVFFIFGENDAIDIIAGKIVLSEVFVKLLTYYIHERIWSYFKFGVVKKTDV